MYREWKEMDFPKRYYIWIWKQRGWKVDQEIDGKMKWGRMEDLLEEGGGRKGYIKGMEEAPENSKELLHSANANGMNEWLNMTYTDLGIKQAVVTNKRALQQEKVENTEPDDHGGSSHHHAD